MKERNIRGEVMSKPIYLKPTKKRKSKIVILISSGLLFIALAFGALFFMYKNEEPVLTHSWQSDETGVVLTFTEEGTVIFKDNLPSGIYHIVSPNSMEYTVDQKTFLMCYRIENKKLYWGMDESSLESFSRYY